MHATKKRTPPSGHSPLALGLAGIALLLCLAANALAAEGTLHAPLNEAETLKLLAGRTMILQSPQPVKRVMVSDNEVVEPRVLDSRTIALRAIKAGSTSLNIWHNKSPNVSLYVLNVSLDLGRLKNELHQTFPEEKDLRVSASHESITLAGRVSSTAVLDEIMAITRSYAQESKINNLVQVGGVHQVMLEVRVAEMSRTLGRQLGVNFGYETGKDFGVSTLGGLSQLQWDDASLSGFPDEFSVASSINALFRFHKGSASWTGLIDALKSEGLVKIMAEPTLIALSGQEASFLAGGEFPYPVPSDENVGIEYKEFGVNLQFAPKVLSNKKINIQVRPEVSELDFSRSLQYEGFRVPGLTTRRASTTVELADGQSFAVAGMLKEQVQDNVDKFPLLGDVPVLGTLFRSKRFQKGETELVIIVTPHLVKPLDTANQSLPTDFYQEPSDAEFYLLGLMQGRNSDRRSMFGQFDGEFGHAMPE